MKYILIFAVVVLYANAVPTNQPSPLKFDGEGQLYQEDMILDKEQMAELRSPSITKSDGYRWPNAQVPYRFDSTAVPYRPAIMQGIQHWQTNTCIQFHLVPDTYSEAHIKFQSLGRCAGTVGRRRDLRGGQTVSIKKGCTLFGKVAHEIGHALGFRHEQARIDRDDYVKYLSANVQSSKTHNFDVDYSTETYGVPYDLGSLMHYPPNLFAIGDKNTLVTKDPFKHFLIGQRGSLSFWDIKRANLMYNCAENCTGVTCDNGGFVDKKCDCVCPIGFLGDTCQDEYAIPAGLTCGGNITQPTTIEKITTSKTVTKCVWVVTAPQGKIVNAEFKKFDFANRGSKGRCDSGYLELRTNDLYDGVKYCGVEVRKNTSKTSESNTLVFLMYTAHHKTGFEAAITFV